jgi:DHA1 family bicyclomycin/chloramphenicol resistance-like MFS transporter
LNKAKNISSIEFVAMMALLMSLAALSIDAMLPALPQMANDLGIVNANDSQLIITSLFLGLALGQMFYGPLSDTYGRKPIVYLGISIFLVGTIFSIFSNSFMFILIGRVIQGFGVASTRVVTVAIVRDRYSGNAMAEVMSLITMVFILVPALAPSIGQVILLFYSWRDIFWLFFILAIVGMVWFYFRQEETLPNDKRIILSLENIKSSIIRTMTTRVTLGYTIASSLIFGAFIGYLISSQQLFVGVYNTGEAFPLYFAVLALSIGCASFINSKLVKKHGMIKLTRIALAILCTSSVIFISYTYLHAGTPPFIAFMVYMIFAFGSIGILFGNLNSLAIEPLGDIAGLATGVISTIQNIISLSLATLIGSQFRGDIYPIIFGFTILGIISFIIVLWVEKGDVDEAIN